MILEVYPSGPVDTNVILIGCEITKRGSIIDAPQDCMPQVMQWIKHYGLSVDMLLLTHTHQDHIADVSVIKKKLNVQVYVHPLDAPNLENPGADLLPQFIPVKGVIPDHFLQDKELLQCGDLEIEVIHTPGHTPGSVCFYLKDHQLLLSGDTLFFGSMGRVDFPQSEPEAMWESLKKLAKLPPETKVVPGHGKMTTIGREASWMNDAKRRFGDE